MQTFDNIRGCEDYNVMSSLSQLSSCPQVQSTHNYLFRDFSQEDVSL